MSKVNMMNMNVVYLYDPLEDVPAKMMIQTIKFSSTWDGWDEQVSPVEEEQ